MDTRPIGMFDSGVGGMTVFKEISEAMPNEDIIYIGDTASFPYGSKSKETIIELTRKRIQELIEKNAKLIVIACGTATSQALEEVQKEFDVPIIGIIEPTVKYLKEKNIKKVGVIATVGTIRSNGWKNALLKEIQNVELQNRECAMLAPMAEEGWTENEIAKLAVHEYLKGLKDMDALILGCTHYPLFKKLIVEELKPGTEVINTGEMVSKEVENYIRTNKMENEKNHKANYKIYLTDTECNFLNVAKKLLKDDNITEKIEKI